MGAKVSEPRLSPTHQDKNSKLKKDIFTSKKMSKVNTPKLVPNVGPNRPTTKKKYQVSEKFENDLENEFEKVDFKHNSSYITRPENTFAKAEKKEWLKERFAYMIGIIKPIICGKNVFLENRKNNPKEIPKGGQYMVPVRPSILK
jgi:hypothetical protein